MTGGRLSDEDRRAWCRELGPTALVVLEELVSIAAPDDVGLVARSNVRQLSSDLGLSKDTAARAVRRLLTAGVVRRTASGRGERGQFGRSGYRFDVVRLGLLGEQARSAPRTKARAKPITQASLFDPGSTGFRS